MHHMLKTYTAGGCALAPPFERSRGGAKIRVVEVCDEHLTAPSRAAELVSGFRADGSGPQWELPPIHDQHFVAAKDLMSALANTRQDEEPIEVVVNDLGMLDLARQLGIAAVLGRAFNKSGRRLPDHEALELRHWIALDAPANFLSGGCPVLPYANCEAIEALKMLGARGVDIDGETDKAAAATVEIGGRLAVHQHLDDVWMATGRTCLYRAVAGACDPSACASPSFSFSYVRRLSEKGDLLSEETSFFTRGKSVYRSPSEEPSVSPGIRATLNAEQHS